MIDRDEMHAVLMRAGTPVHVADAWVEELMLRIASTRRAWPACGPSPTLRLRR